MVSRIVVFYLLAWFLLMLLGGLQQATGLLPPEIGLAQWGPGLAALLMLVIFRKDRHQITFFSKETPAIRYIYAALIPVGAALVIFLVRALIPIQASSDAPAYGSLVPLIVWMPFGAIGEELGWRGYLHKRMDPGMRGLLSSLLVGLLWMPIHVAFLGRGAVVLLALTFVIVSYSVVIYALVQDTAFSVALAGVFHLFINLSNLPFLDVIYEPQFMMINALIWVVVAAVTIYIKRDIFFHTKQ